MTEPLVSALRGYYSPAFTETEKEILFKSHVEKREESVNKEYCYR